MAHHNLFIAILRTTLCTTALIFLLINTSNAQNSLFDKAIKLDNLYDNIQRNLVENNNVVLTDDAESFFGVLRTLYTVNNEVDDPNINEAIRQDLVSITQNPYLREEVEIVFNALDIEKKRTQQQIAQLLREKTLFYDEVISEAKNNCGLTQSSGVVSLTVRPTAPIANPRSQRDTCLIRSEILALEFSKNLQNLNLLQKKIEEIALSTGDSTQQLIFSQLNVRLTNVKQSIVSIDAQLNQLEEKAGEFAQSAAGVGSNIPFQNPATQANPASAIIIQQAGNASLESSIIDGASKWIAERMREELNIAFFDRFENWVEKRNIQLLLPATFAALRSSITTDYELMIQVFKTAFEKDLKKLPFHIANFLEKELEHSVLLNELEQELLLLGKERDKATFKALKLIDNYEDLSPEEEKALAVLNNEAEELHQAFQDKQVTVENFHKTLKYVLFTIKAIELLSEGEHISSLLSYLNENIDELFPQSGYVKPALLLMDIISRSLISVDQTENTVWIDVNKFDQLRDNPQLRHFYFGLIYLEAQQAIRRIKNQLEQEKMVQFEQFLVDSNKDAEINAQIDSIDTYISDALSLYGFYLLDSRGYYTAEGIAEEVTNSYYSYLSQDIKAHIYDVLVNYFNTINADETLSEQYTTRSYSDSYLALDTLKLEFNALVIEKCEAIIGDQFEENERIIADYGLSNIMANKTLYFPDQVANAAEIDVFVGDYWEDVANNVFSKYDYESYSKLDKDAFKNDVDLNKRLGEIYSKNVDLNNQITRVSELLQPSVNKVYFEFTEQRKPQIRAEKLKQIESEFPQNHIFNYRSEQLEDQKAFIDQLLVGANREGNDQTFGGLINDFFHYANRIDNLQSQFKILKEKDQANFGIPEFIYLLKKCDGCIKPGL